MSTPQDLAFDPESPAFQRARLAAEAAGDKLGHDVVIFDVGDILSITHYFVVASANNTRQVKAIVEEVELAVKVFEGASPIGTEGLNDASWVLLDYGDVVIHVFLDETRQFYDLDRLWSDVPRMEFTPAEPSGA